MFSFILNQLKETLAAREEVLRDAIKDRVREHGGRLVGWAVGASIASRVLTAVNAELERMGPDSSELRDAFDEWVHREIARLETDPARAAELGQALKGVLAHDSVRAWAWDIWVAPAHGAGSRRRQTQRPKRHRDRIPPSPALATP